MSVCVEGDAIEREIRNSYKVSFNLNLEYKKLKCFIWRFSPEHKIPFES